MLGISSDRYTHWLCIPIPSISSLFMPLNYNDLVVPARLSGLSSGLLKTGFFKLAMASSSLEIYKGIGPPNPQRGMRSKTVPDRPETTSRLHV